MPKQYITLVILLYGFVSCAWDAGESEKEKTPATEYNDSMVHSPSIVDIVPLTKAEILIEREMAFRSSLPPDLFEWTTHNANLYAIIVNEFITDYTPRNELIAYYMIWSMAYNDNYSEDQFIADNDEFNEIYNGSVVEIPDSFQMDDGSLVSICFGDTYSDTEQSNKMVSPLLVEVLKTSLKKANSVLIEKIASVEIKATTNGTHHLRSNHYNKTALDISKVNGQQIFLSATENGVFELQKAFDENPKIRENFGPFFKHKTETDGIRNNHFKIPGCFDHIHISVQSN
ncbi:hypothetical protein [Flavobacterium sp.]|uniref:hypothetical protein n=1 Tax=Flavobacterium sp. TaxID=239 RepID=UPI00263425C7|nr:hypothetical protein [Flavobacterium sp.]